MLLLGPLATHLLLDPPHAGRIEPVGAGSHCLHAGLRQLDDFDPAPSLDPQPRRASLFGILRASRFEGKSFQKPKSQNADPDLMLFGRAILAAREKVECFWAIHAEGG